MSRFLVMPRGINVGTRNRVPMAELRTALAEAGFGDVVTVLQSGNVIVTRPGVDAETVGGQVAGLLSERFGVSVPCVVRSADEVRDVARRNPLADVADDGARYLVTFLSRQPDRDVAATLLAEDHSPEVLHLDGREAYVWTPGGVAAMTLSYTALERRFGCVATARNWNTLERIVARL